ncbi:Rha family transcriptional regulator [Metasolibacillus sp.]|uniref:Rha family transcriptional regulator n=1 Tax=Metasolibacillus sp. TaxID=2703680 RepID=UPI0025DEB1A8|nr:Rha family transcriptional regulator [Metasolibacillus sp.]MCT6922782.1 Rha family transcriptional regulator [Metasolibacillus sp.]MCT6938879.1 Rha family transcriptional regulator [Metasolibacillus sp.]
MTLQQLLNQQEIVYVEKGAAFTNSRIVSEVFQKGHDKVLRDIRGLKCSEAFKLANFGECDYTNAQGRKMPMYTLSFDGFVMLAMGYTGEKAMQFKELYIAAFNRTHKLLAEQNQTLLSSEQKQISRLVQCVIKQAYPQLTTAARQKYYTALYKALRQQFAVMSYKDIPRSKLLDAISFIENWGSPKLESVLIDTNK